MHWTEAADHERMRGFIRRLLSRFRKTAMEMNSYHPYLFQNHAFEEQEVFEGYGEENLNRLRKIRSEVDPEGVMQILQPEFFKLEAHRRDLGIKSEL
jgi:FAD/FMN-containing dehydrogenase